MKAICIIPAKKISNRVPNKNIKSFFGKPMIGHVISNLVKSNCFKEIFVSTDSKKIKDISEKYGAKVPFMRPKHLSNDYTKTIDVIADAIKRLKKNYQFDIVCCVYPTSIFVTPMIIKKAIKILNGKKIKFIFSAKKYEHPIQRAFTISKSKIRPVNKSNFFRRTQDFSESYFDAGQFYISNFKNFIKKKNQFNLPSKAIILKDFDSIDIDTEENLKTAKNIFKFKMRK